MQIVHCVIRHIQYEGDAIDSIWDSEEKADIRLRELEGDTNPMVSFHVLPIEVR